MAVCPSQGEVGFVDSRIGSVRLTVAAPQVPTRVGSSVGEQGGWCQRRGDGVVGGAGQLDGGGIPLVGVFGHAGGDDLDRPGGTFGLGDRGSRRRGVQVCGNQARHRVTGKRWLSGQAFIQHTRQRIDVGAGILFGPVSKRSGAM